MSFQKMVCPECQQLSPCRSINLAEYDPSDSERNYNYGNVHWYMRLRECGECYREFYTAEVAQELLCELIDARDALREIMNLEDDLEKAGTVLQRLKTSLEKLKTQK